MMRLVFVALLAVSVYATPLATMTAIYANSFNGEDSDRFIVTIDSPDGVETHHINMGFSSVDFEYYEVLVSDGGKTAVHMRGNGWSTPRIYLMGGLSGPGEYGDEKETSPALELMFLDHGEFDAFVALQWGWVGIEDSGMRYWTVDRFDEYGNLYGTQRYSGFWAVYANGDQEWHDGLSVDWMNLRPYSYVYDAALYDVAPVPVPEPGALIMLGAALMILGAVALGRRRK